MPGTFWQTALLMFWGILVCGGFGRGHGIAADRPAIVLTAFGTSTAAADTYKHLEQQVRQRFPGYEIRWAYTSQQVRRKVAQEQGQALKDLPQTLRELQAAGFTRIAVQSLHVVPGEEWEEMVRESREIPGLQVALGQPLLSNPEDQERTLQALSKNFPQDLTANAVVLVGHGSPHPQGEGAYLAFGRLLRSRYPNRNVFLGTVQGKPTRDEALGAVQRSQATGVVFIPFLLVAGEHVSKDILGADPESWKSRLLAHKPYRIQEGGRGLGYRDDIVSIYLDHLDGAVKSLAK